MKKIFAAVAVTASLVSSAQACEINSITKFCLERAQKFDSAQVFVDGKPSTDYTARMTSFGYVKISKLSGINQTQDGYVLLTSGAIQQKVPFKVTTKDYAAGHNQIGKAIPGLLNDIRKN
ncbi:hypothetical protein AWB71_05334 [Caballeronia peredens]|nr:hypothetical protein AWB71_05334 [Caballeronia peredens]